MHIRETAEIIFLERFCFRPSKTKNATMAKVSDCITEQQRLLTEEKIDNELQWNSGNHFTEPDLRCAKGFSWCLRKSVPEV